MRQILQGQVLGPALPDLRLPGVCLLPARWREECRISHWSTRVRPAVAAAAAATSSRGQQPLAQRHREETQAPTSGERHHSPRAGSSRPAGHDGLQVVVQGETPGGSLPALRLSAVRHVPHIISLLSTTPATAGPPPYHFTAAAAATARTVAAAQAASASKGKKVATATAVAAATPAIGAHGRREVGRRSQLDCRPSCLAASIVASGSVACACASRLHVAHGHVRRVSRVHGGSGRRAHPRLLLRRLLGRQCLLTG